MAIFFTADTHFGHANIIRYCNRPFETVEEMDEALITAWNERVQRGDTVWHLGDFSMGGPDQAEPYLKRLNGKINLIWGNHDRNAVRAMGRWVTSQYGAEISLDGHHVTLCHYSMRVWNRAHHQALMLYGHSHGTLPGNSQSLDVGVDCWNYRPVTLPEIIERLAQLPSRRAEDHHGADQAS